MQGLWKRGTYRDTVIRQVTEVPVVGHPLRLWGPDTALSLYSGNCGRVFSHNTHRLARRGATTTRRCARDIWAARRC